MSQVQALLDHLAEWAPAAADADRVATVLLGILTKDNPLSIADAPAHPGEMRRWLIETISARVAFATRSSSVDLTVDFDNLFYVLPLVLIHTEVADWPSMPGDLRNCRGEIRFSNDFANALDVLLADRNVQYFLSALGGFFLVPSAFGRQRASLSLEAHWQWPLKIAVDDALLQDPRVQRANHIVRRLGLAQLVSKSDEHGAAIYLVIGDSASTLAEITNKHKERYAYVLGTGVLRKTSDLKRITNKARGAGAAMLGWKSNEIAPNLVRMLIDLRSVAFRESTFESWLRQPRDVGFTICYAHPEALNLTAPLNAMRLLQSSLVRYFGAVAANELLVAHARELSQSDFQGALVSLPSIEMPLDKEEASIWWQSVRRLTAALNVSESFGTPDDYVSLNTAYRSIETVSEGKYSGVGPHLSESPRSLDYFSLDDSSEGIEIDDEPAGAQSVESPTGGEVHAQATLLCNGSPVERLNPELKNVLAVQLAESGLQAIQADAPFPVEMLPPGGDQIALTFLLVPLAGVSYSARGIPEQIECVFSKEKRKSGVCRFSIESTPNAAEFRARLVILHANRVLQSFMVHIPGARASKGATMHLVAENIVRSDFSNVHRSRPYDLAIVANHDHSSQSGLLMVTKSRAEFREPKSFPQLLNAVSEQLKLLNDGENIAKSAKGRNDHLTNSLNELANLGYEMRQLLCSGNEELEALTKDSLDPAKPTRIQVVEAVPDAFLPVEVFYDGPAPQSGAPLCAKLATQDYPLRTCNGCTDRGRDDLICPSRFWGLSKVIERRPYGAEKVSGGADYAVSAAQLNHVKVPELRNVVFGVSAKFKKNEKTKILASLKRLNVNVLPANDWADWKSAVAQHQPEMLVAIGHVVRRHSAIDSLEISGDLLRSTNIDASYVCADAGNVPVVLLLGCGTLYTEHELGNFVRHFSKHGAGLIVATIASMLTLQAQLCVDMIAQSFKQAREVDYDGCCAGHNTVGFAVLRAKQALISAGSGLGLGLTGAGDGEWAF